MAINGLHWHFIATFSKASITITFRYSSHQVYSATSPINTWRMNVCYRLYLLWHPFRRSWPSQNILPTRHQLSFLNLKPQAKVKLHMQMLLYDKEKCKLIRYNSTEYRGMNLLSILQIGGQSGTIHANVCVWFGRVWQLNWRWVYPSWFAHLRDHRGRCHLQNKWQ